MAQCAQHRARVAVPLALRAGLSSERQARTAPLKWPGPATWAGVPASAVRTHPLAGAPLALPDPRPLRRPASLARWKRTSSLRTGAAQSAHARGPRNSRGRCPTATATGRRRLSRRCASNEPRRRRFACRFRAARYGGPDRRSSSGTRRRPTGGRRPPPREQAPGASSVQRLLVMRSAPICRNNQPSPIRRANKIAYDESGIKINLLKRE